MPIEVIFDKLYEYFSVNSDLELAKKMGTSQPSVSKWRTKAAISAIKKKCRELGIYNEIFGDGGQTLRKNEDTKKLQTNFMFPEYLIDELNTLFSRMKNDKEESDLIDALDLFIYEQKKKLRK